jgi:hypothetical protein
MTYHITFSVKHVFGPTPDQPVHPPASPLDALASDQDRFTRGLWAQNEEQTRAVRQDKSVEANTNRWK